MRGTWVLLVVVVAGLTVACGSDKRSVTPTGPAGADGVVVERTTLRTHDGLVEWCGVEGTVRNDPPRDRRVTFTLTALDGEGRAVCVPAGGDCRRDVELVVPAGGRADFAEEFFFGSCNGVARVEISHLDSEPAG